MIIDLTDTTSSEIASALLRARRNSGSPTFPKIWAIGIPIWRTRRLSTSISGAFSRSATSLPMVLLPDPGSPIKSKCRRFTWPPNLRT